MVKEMRLAKVKTIAQANALLDGGLLAKHNRLFGVPAGDSNDAHRVVGTAFNVAAIRLDKPIYPGERVRRR